MAGTRVLLVRHGQSEWNAHGRWQGHADPPLSDLGRAQAAAAAAAIGAVDAVVASDLQRAAESAAIIAAAIGVGPVLVESRLRERDAGEWTGLTRHEIEAGWPGALAEGLRPDGFEADESVLDRVLAALHDLGREMDGATVLAVTHAGVIRTLERHLDQDHPILANMEGRHLEVRDGRIVAGPRTLLLDPDAATVTAPRSL